MSAATLLRARVPRAASGRAPWVGCVCHRPRVSGGVGHEPRTAGPWRFLHVDRGPVITRDRAVAGPRNGSLIIVDRHLAVDEVTDHNPACCPFRGRAAGTGSSAGHWGHRTTVASTIWRWAELVGAPLPGQGATSLGLGAATRASAASATFPWSIDAPRLIGGAGVPLNHRQAWITITGEFLRLA